MPDRKPNLFIIGAPKCGTSALAAYLSEHSQVFICEPKEPFFWSSDYPGLRKRHGIDSTEKYLRLFDRVTSEHTIIGEGSTNYLRSDVAVDEILKFNPNAKFIVMLRNPVEVVHAFHSEVHFSRIEDEPDFETAWRLQEARSEGKNLPPNCEAPQFLQYAKVASYAEQIERLFNLVPEPQRKVIIFADFKSDNASVFEDTQRFLGLDIWKKTEFERVNAAHDHRSQLVAKLVLDPPPALKPLVETARRFARRFQGGLIEKAKHWFRKPMKRKPLTPEFQSELEEYFRDDIEKLSTLLQRDLSCWYSDGRLNETPAPTNDESREVVGAS